MTSERRSLNRRHALAGLGVAGLALAATTTATAARQADEAASHPLVGIWLGVTPDGPSPAYFNADGTFYGSSAPMNAGPDGVITFVSPQNGVWEPDPENERGIHFTSVQNRHDATGAFLVTVTVDGYPVASEDGDSLYDDAQRVRVTIRDAEHNVEVVLGEDGSLPPVYGLRLRPGEPRFHDGTPPGTGDSGMATPET